MRRVIVIVIVIERLPQRASKPATRALPSGENLGRQTHAPTTPAHQTKETARGGHGSSYTHTLPTHIHAGGQLAPETTKAPSMNCANAPATRVHMAAQLHREHTGEVI